MKAIVDGLRYDTEKAELVGECETPGMGRSDFKYWSAGLYKTKSGRFFLAGEGHALTRFAAHTGEGASWGENLIPMGTDEALSWAEDFLDVETIEAVFSDHIEEA